MAKKDPAPRRERKPRAPREPRAPKPPKQKAPTPPPICPYCNLASVFLASSESLYRRDWGPVWYCDPCHAWVGCHKGTDRPLGRLANEELREAKKMAHAAFDPLWKRRMEISGLTQGHARGKGYKWLAGQLGLEPGDCHIGMMDVATCFRVVEICRPILLAQRSRGPSQGAMPLAEASAG